MSRAKHQADGIGELPWDTIPALLAAAWTTHGDLPALIDGDVTLDYRALGQQVEVVSGNLVRIGIGPGDSVVIWSHNCWQWVVCALAAWSAGAIVVPLSSRLKALEALPVLRATQSRLLLTTTNCNRANLPDMLREHCNARGRDIHAELPHLAAIGVYEDCDTSTAALPLVSWRSLTDATTATTPASVEVGANDLCEIMFTSGSTGKPKGVMLGQRQTLRIMWDAGFIWKIERGDRALIIAPLSHVTGINAGLLAGLMRGATLVLLDVFQPRKALALIEAHGITAMAGPPAMFKQLLVENAQGDALKSLRKVSILGAPVPAALIGELRAGTSIEFIFTGYGMTECSSIATTRESDPADVVMGTVGHPMPGLEVRVADEHGEDLSGRSHGEIQVRGYGVMRGYLGDEALTRATITKDGWLRTGDIGELTPEGRLRLLGREKEMYIAYGFNVFPAEVEFLLLQSELVAAVAVVARPNRFSGEDGVAFVVPKDNAQDAASVIMKWARQNMANYKVPSKIIVVDELPLNANGKVDKLALKNRLEQA